MFLTFKATFGNVSCVKSRLEDLFLLTRWWKNYWEEIKCFWVVNQSTRLHPFFLLCKYWLIDKWPQGGAVVSMLYNVIYEHCCTLNEIKSLKDVRLKKSSITNLRKKMDVFTLTYVLMLSGSFVFHYVQKQTCVSNYITENLPFLSRISLIAAP